MALFLTANGVGEDAEVPAFLSIIGGKAYAVLRDLLAPTPPKDKAYNVLEDTLRQHYQPTVVVIAERFHFHRRAQGPEESVAEFLAELRRLAMHCDFKTHLNEALSCQKRNGPKTAPHSTFSRKKWNGVPVLAAKNSTLLPKIELLFILATDRK